MKPVRPSIAYSVATVAIVALNVGAYCVTGMFGWHWIPAAAAGIWGLARFLMVGGINPGYTDPAIEQNRQKRAEIRQLREEQQRKRQERRVRRRRSR